MKISVAVPSYNYAQYIGACLASIQMQSHADFEVLIADGGSTDGSLKIIEGFCDSDARFKLVSREDQGQPDAVNKALKFADGEILCYLNADDIYLGDAVFGSIVQAFNSFKDVSVISSGGYYVDEKGRYIKPVRLRYHPLDNIGWMKYRAACLQPGIFWKKHVFEAIGFKTEFHFSFDSVFFYEAYTRYSWLELPDITAGYRLHSENKSLMIKYQRIVELARFEQIKFGKYSLRAIYLFLISGLVSAFSSLPWVGRALCKGLYLVVNSISFISAYRLPGI